MASEYLAYQFSGPYVQALINSIEHEISIRDQFIEYLATLSLDTANDTELENLGLLIGLPWPYAPVGTFDYGDFIFGDSSLFPEYSQYTGFGDTNDSSIGGLLTSVYSTVSTKIPASYYIIMLKAVAYLKMNGLNIKSIDKTVASLWGNYSIKYYGDYDVEIVLNGDELPLNTYLLETIFEVFTTDPQIVIVRS